MNKYGRKSFMPSNYLAIENENCIGCGKCEKVCPCYAITMLKPDNDNKLKKKKIKINKDICLGCGACKTVCKFNAIEMKRREVKKQVIVPDTYLERVIKMAINRKRLHKFFFYNPDKLSHRILGKICKAIEEAPTTNALLAIEPLKSYYLNFVVKIGNVGLKEVFKNV
jgi:formate hydrogenlyase subunit 6/NADH:ubiquinone oxidoreductase subunit I